MAKKTIRFGVLFFVLIFSGAMVWAGGGQTNLKGKDITIGHWWAGVDTNTARPTDELGEQVLEWRKKIQRDHGFTIKEIQVADWSGMLEAVITSVMAGKPAASTFYLEPSWAMALMKQDLLYPISDSKAVDFSVTTSVAGKQLAWNRSIQELFTYNGKFYATSPLGTSAQHAIGIYFNKRLFREAGLDPDLPYNMQRDGTWNWENFINVCKSLTRDRNNTGRVDTWAMPADLEDRIFEQIIFSNGGCYIDRDAQGRFVNATGRPEFLEAMQFALRLVHEGVMMPRPQNADWEWYWPRFTDGIVAMAVEPEWRRGEIIGSMTDDWGFVLFPKGPRQQNYRIANDDIAMVIPSSTAPADADAILTAVNLWCVPVSDDWKASLWGEFRDRRAVEETMAIVRDPRYSAFRYHIMIPGLQIGDVAWHIWWWDLAPSQLVEQVSPHWNTLITNANSFD